MADAKAKKPVAKKAAAKKVAPAKDPVAKKPTVKKVTEQKAPIVDQTLAPVNTAATDAVEKQATPTKTIAKAGKRSEKALKEAEEKQAKEERKATVEETSASVAKQHVHQRTAADRLKRRGKKFQKAFALIDKTKEYSLNDALELAAKTSPVKFDATVEMHINLGVDPKHADQNIRGNLVLPAGTGKSIRIAVFAEGEDAEKAKKAGADIAGTDELLNQLEKGLTDFDTLISTPLLMARLGKYARLLGPKGLMPNPKSGTVTTNVAKAVAEAKAGRVEYRVDSTGIVHLGCGKTSFGAEKLSQNARAVLTSIKSAKPASIKGTYIKSIHITTSMGPSVRVMVSEAV